MSVTTTAPQAEPEAGGSGLRTTRSALALLRERSWLGALLGVVLISILFVYLGRWQYHRYESRSARNAIVNANFDATPRPLADLLPRIGPGTSPSLPKQLEWTQVALSGEYLTGDTVLLRNRPLEDASGNSENGYDVVVPFRTVQGQVLFVDRGTIPAGSLSAARPDSVPAPPVGRVEVVARLRPSEPGSSRRAPAGQADRLDVSRFATSLRSPALDDVVGAYGALVSESPAASSTPVPQQKPDPGLVGINQAYAVQWVAFAIAAYVMLGVGLVREVRRREEHETGTDPATSSGPRRRSTPAPVDPLTARYGGRRRP